MAERGGARRPNDRTPKAPGVGRSSKRTDTQLIRTPNAQEGTDLRIGDRERIAQMQRDRPLGASPAPQVQQGGASVPAGGGRGGPPPAHLAEMPTNRPLEDPMVAPPPLPDPDDDREFVLAKLAGPPFNNQAVADMLRDLRASKVAPVGVEPTSLGYEPSGDAASPTAQPDLTDMEDEPQEVFDLGASETEVPPEEQEAEPSVL